MGIDAIAYRYRIGVFEFRKKRRVQRKNKIKAPKMNRNNPMFFMLLTFLMIHSPGPAIPRHSWNISFSTNSSFSPITQPSNISSTTSTISWSYCCQTNALQHSLNGNKRRLGYKLASWNCNRGLVKHVDGMDSDKLVDIKLFINEHKPHLFAILEADIHGHNSRVNRQKTYEIDEIKDKLKIEGYSIETPATWNAHDQARLIVFVSDDIKAKKLEVSENDNDLPSLSFEIGLGRERKTIVNFFYREWTSGIDGTSSVQDQKERLKRQILHWKYLASRDRDLIIMGDANLCAKTWNNVDYPNDKKELANMVTDFLLEDSLSQMVNEFTRTELKGGRIEQSCIDHIYSNCLSKCDEAKVIAAGNSDHLGVTVTKYSKEIRTLPRTTKKRSYKNFSEEEFLREIKYTNFEDILNINDPNEAAEKFTDIFSRVADNHAPIKVFQTRPNYAPWVSDATKQLMSDRNDLKKESVRSADPEVLRKYKSLRNVIKEINENEKSDYYGDKFKAADDENNSKKMWGLAFEILKSKSNLSPTQLNIEGVPSSNPKMMANEFNRIFINNVKRLRTKPNQTVPGDPCVHLRRLLNKRGRPIPELSFRKITEEELDKYIRKLKGNKSSGIDQIDSFLLKLAAPHIKRVLLHLLNLSISISFPDHWKLQLIRPNFKKGDKLDGESYRPVSNIPEVSKMAEFAMFDQLFQHFLGNNLFHPNHHGFLPLHNTSTAIIQLYDLWLEAAENKEMSAALLLDLSAAFDLVDHSILLQKLELYNLSPSALQLIKSYLTNRRQVVQVETKISEPEEIGDVAVPQGSVLGGLIFLIFQNDFPESAEDEDLGESILYADDDTDTVSDKEPEQLQAKIQAKADNSTKWYADNGMVCSGEKTKLLIISTKELRRSKLTSVNKSVNISVCGKSISESKSERLLGLTIRNDLSWADHLYGNGLSGKDKTIGLLSQLSQRVGILKKLKHFTRPNQFSSISNGIFTSKMTYGIQVFGNVWGMWSMDDISRRFHSFTKEDNRKLQVLQNQVLRLQTGLGWETPTSQLVSEARAMSVQQLTAYHTLMTVFKAVRLKKPTYLAEKFRLRQPSEFETFPHRQTNTINASAGLTISRGGTVYRGAKLWNLLSQDLRNEEKIEIFKQMVKKWIFRNVPIKPP